MAVNKWIKIWIENHWKRCQIEPCYKLEIHFPRPFVFPSINLFGNVDYILRFKNTDIFFTTSFWHIDSWIEKINRTQRFCFPKKILGIIFNVCKLYLAFISSYQYNTTKSCNPTLIYIQLLPFHGKTDKLLQ